MIAAMIRLGLLAALVLVLLADSAFGAVYPGQRAASDLQPEVQAALDAWAARGVIGCPAGVAPYWADDLGIAADGTPAIGRGRPCELWLSAPAHAEQKPQWMRAAWRCVVIEHEIGHALDLGHDAAAQWPIMSASWMWSDRCQRVTQGKPRRKARHKQHRRHRVGVVKQVERGGVR